MIPLIAAFELASEKFFACYNVMSGGSGGTSGSVFTSSTTGISLASASSQAEPQQPRAIDKDAASADQLGKA
jgi:hypothetical protein